MRINPINFSFTGSKRSLGDVKALRGLDLDDVFVDTKTGAAKRYNSEKTKENRDEFVLSHASLASRLAEEMARENPDLSFDDLFQEIMLGIVEYTSKCDSRHKDVKDAHIYEGLDKIKQRQAKREEYIRDVKPVDERDMVDIIAAKDAPADIEKAMETLTPAQKAVISERCGFDTNPKTRKEIADEYGVPTHVIGKIESMALRRLRYPDRAKKLFGVLKSIESAEK